MKFHHRPSKTWQAAFTAFGSSASNGVATFSYSVNTTKQGVGTYRVDVSASKSGYNSTTDSTTFAVTK